jgi:hypothetical protein
MAFMVALFGLNDPVPPVHNAPEEATKARSVELRFAANLCTITGQDPALASIGDGSAVTTTLSLAMLQPMASVN